MIITPPQIEESKIHRASKEGKKKETKKKKLRHDGDTLSPKEKLDKVLGGDSDKIRHDIMRDLEETKIKETSSKPYTFEHWSQNLVQPLAENEFPNRPWKHWQARFVQPNRPSYVKVEIHDFADHSRHRSRQ